MSRQSAVLSECAAVSVQLTGMAISPLTPEGALLYLALPDIWDAGRDAFYRRYAGRMLLRKYDKLPTGIDKTAVAVRSFLDGEAQCLATNERFARPIPAEFLGRLDWARKWIERTLGPFSWDHAIQYCDFSAGAAVGLPRRSAQPVKKIGLPKPTATNHCEALLMALSRYDHRVKYRGGVQWVESAEATTVPKDARGDRFIAVEPRYNMFFQKGIGGMIRTRVKRAGLDLNQCWKQNMDLARKGSADGSLATLDLKAASDTIASGLIEAVIPSDWLSAMKMVRTEKINLRRTGVDKVVLLRKFSTMGNGFTWELESIVFLALTLACYPDGLREGTVSVFGDDIICPTHVAAEVMRLLVFCGFTINTDKSFVEGPFRESCGGHYWEGTDVTPAYVKKLGSLSDEIHACNSLSTVAYRMVGCGFGRDARLRPHYERAIQSLPNFARNTFVPFGSESVGLMRDFDDACPSKPEHWLEGWCQRSLHEIPTSQEEIVWLDNKGRKKRTRRARVFNGRSALVHKLWADRRMSETGTVSRGIEKPSATKLRVLDTPVPMWCDAGMWL